MDDRELLELAAKAAGLDAVKEMYGRSEDGSIFCDANDPPTEWNPLTDDGAAEWFLPENNYQLLELPE